MKRLRALLTTPPARLVAATILLLIVATPIALVSLGRAGAHSGAHTIPAS